MIEFKAFPKIARLNRDCSITEKIDGTNAVIHIQDTPATVFKEDGPLIDEINGLFIYAGSRSRWIKPGDDNFGFAAWVKANAEELIKLGQGTHFGEWWGHGIQRGYGQINGDRHFSLFNTARWYNSDQRPACCGVVPLLYTGIFSTGIVEDIVRDLHLFGSRVGSAGAKSEGVVVYHHASNNMYKVTCEHDDKPKGEVPKEHKPQPARVKDPSKGGRRKEQRAFNWPDRRKV